MERDYSRRTRKCSYIDKFPQNQEYRGHLPDRRISDRYRRIHSANEAQPTAEKSENKAILAASLDILFSDDRGGDRDLFPCMGDPS